MNKYSCGEDEAKIDCTDVDILPTECERKNGISRAVFDRAELERFVEQTSETSHVVRDDAGNVIGIMRVQPIRDWLFSERRPASGTCPTEVPASS